MASCSMVSQKRSPRSTSEVMAASMNRRGVTILRTAHRELAHQRRAGARGGLVGELGDAPVQRRIAGQLAQVLADQ